MMLHWVPSKSEASRSLFLCLTPEEKVALRQAVELRLALIDHILALTQVEIHNIYAVHTFHVLIRPTTSPSLLGTIYFC